MARSNKNWRKEVTDLIPSVLEAHGITKFDSTDYSFPINDDVIGLVWLVNQPKRYPNPNLTEIALSSCGVLHWQLSYLVQKLGPPKVDWSTPNRQVILLDQWIDLEKDTDISLKRSQLDAYVKQLDATILQDLRSNYNTLQKILESKEVRIPAWNIRIPALILAGQHEEALADCETQRQAHKSVENQWTVFFSKFDAWRDEGFPIPDRETAKSALLKKAPTRYIIDGTL